MLFFVKKYWIPHYAFNKSHYILWNKKHNNNLMLLLYSFSNNYNTLTLLFAVKVYTIRQQFLKQYSQMFKIRMMIKQAYTISN